MPAGVRPVMALVTGIAEYHVQVLSGMVRALTPRGVPLLVVANEPFASQRTPTIVLDLIRHGVPRGVVALADTSTRRGRDTPTALARTTLPTVTLGTKFPGTPRVVGDNVSGMRDLMRHLLDDCGVRRPVLIRGERAQIDSREREQVFREELSGRGLPVDPAMLIDGRFRPEIAYAGLRALLERGTVVDAVVALNDPSAFGALTALVDHGLRVPQDVLLTGFDNTESSEASWPALTTVDQGLREQGRRAAELILQRCGPGAGTDDDTDVVVPSRLVVRASTRRPGTVVAEAPDPDVAEEAVPTALALQARAGLHDAALVLNRTMANCRTVDDVVRGLDACLPRMGIQRCFLCLDEPLPSGRLRADHPTRLVLSHRGGVSDPTEHEPFPRLQLLPPGLRHELEHGVLLLQALSIGGRERGFVLYEPAAESSVLTEALRIDLPRTVDTVLGSRELSDRAAMLERLVAERTQELARLNSELKHSALRDGLTGLANRMALDEYFEELRAPGGGITGTIAVLMVDVDRFKAFNDRYGHPTGDRALKSVASCLQRAVRNEQDLACRFGGEEFAVVLRETGPDGARSVARRIRQLLARAAIRHDGSDVAPIITVSIGVATARCEPGGLTPSEVITLADQALYQAKERGRDRIVVAAVPESAAVAEGRPARGDARDDGLPPLPRQLPPPGARVGPEPPAPGRPC